MTPGAAASQLTPIRSPAQGQPRMPSPLDSNCRPARLTSPPLTLMRRHRRTRVVRSVAPTGAPSEIPVATADKKAGVIEYATDLLMEEDGHRAYSQSPAQTRRAWPLARLAAGPAAPSSRADDSPDPAGLLAGRPAPSPVSYRKDWIAARLMTMSALAVARLSPMPVAVLSTPAQPGSRSR